MLVAVNIILAAVVVSGMVALIGWAIRHEHKLYGAKGVKEPRHVVASRRMRNAHHGARPANARRYATASPNRA